MMRQIYPEVRPIDTTAELEAAYEMGQGPSLRADFVASLDGAIEIGGRSRKLGGPSDRAAFSR